MNEQLEYGIKLKQLTINNFRCFGELNVAFDDRLTVFIAENGGGKTAILDAVAEGLKAYLEALSIDTTPCSFKAQDITVGRGAKTENEVLVELSYPVELGYIGEEEGVSDQVNEAALPPGYGAKTIANDEQDERKAEVLELEMDGKTERDVKLLVDISQDGDSAFRLSSTSVVASYESYAAQRVNKDIGAGIIMPVLLYIGGNSPELTEKKQDKAKNRTSNIYEDALSANRINFTAFFRWFESRYLLFLQEKTNDATLKLEAFDPELAKIKWAVEEMLNDEPDNKKYDDLRIKYSKQGGKMVLGKKNDAGKYDDIEIKQLSSGEKALFALVADLGFRLLNAHPIEKTSSEVKDVAAVEGAQSINGKGIVLIDEVDLHLHPKWQRKVVGKLMNIFPEVQWVMTTHSPFVLANVLTEQARVLIDNKCLMIKDLLPNFSSYGADLEKIVSLLFKLSDYIPSEVNELFKSYFAAIDANEYDEAAKIEEELVSLTDKNHSKLIEGRAQIEYKELLATVNL